MATAPGRGGVAVVRVSGPAAFRIAEALTGRRVDASLAGRFFHSVFHSVGSRVPRDRTPLVGRRDPSPPPAAPDHCTARALPGTPKLCEGGACGVPPPPVPIDDGLVLVFAGPRSYTGEDVIEFQGHGGAVAPRRVLESCLAAGARLARRGEFTLRAFLNGRLDLGRAEAVIDLVDARTGRAADDATARLLGAQTRPFEAMYAQALDVSSLVEHALDFSEDELPADFPARTGRAIADLLAAVERQISTAREGRLLREGALVVLAGAPNAGKSSLLNALLGADRAIVSDEAGTTRDSIEEGAEIGGWPVRLVDTAGLRDSDNAIEREGVSRAEELIAAADLVLHLTPADAPHSNISNSNIQTLPSVIPVLSKCDLVGRRDPSPPSAGLPVSARTGEGLAELRAAIASHLASLAAKDAEEAGADVTTRQLEALLASQSAFQRAQSALALPDWVVAANELRDAAESLGRVLGKVYSDDLLDALFSRFCIGK